MPEVRNSGNHLVLFEKMNPKTMSDQAHKTSFEQHIIRHSGLVVKVTCQPGLSGDPRFDLWGGSNFEFSNFKPLEQKQNRKQKVNHRMDRRLMNK